MGNSPLARQEGESHKAHRALLLYAISGERRSPAVLSRVLVIPSATIRSWVRRYQWEARYAATPSPDADAYLVYQQDYLAKCGTSAILKLVEEIENPAGFLAQVDPVLIEQDGAAHRKGARLTPRIRPVATPSPAPEPSPAAPTVATVAEVSQARPATPIVVLGATHVEQEKPPEKAVDPEVVSRVLASMGVGAEVVSGSQPATVQVPAAPPIHPSIERSLRLIEGALGYCAQALKDQKVPVTLAGMVGLLRMQQLLLGKATSNVAVVVAQAQAGAAAPTVRVQQARTEAERLAAFRGDLADLSAIVEGIEAMRERDEALDAVTTGDERERA